MENLNKKQKIVILSVLILIIIFIGYYIIHKTRNSDEDKLDIIEEENIYVNNSIIEETEKEIIVHITGEVIYNGVIKIEKGSRISDVIEKAGGLTEEADLSRVNLAYQVQDGQKIYIPNVNSDLEQENPEEYVTESAGDNIIIEEKNNKGKVNINTAMQTELETLNGIGPSTALKIIEYRNKNGEFKTIEDLKNVIGIGNAKFENIKENICVK